MAVEYAPIEKVPLRMRINEKAFPAVNEAEENRAVN